jgi:DNA-directed RNA polymerase subunit RPC12/RpoP
MLDFTPEELVHITDYMASQAPDLTVEFAQKVYAENVLNHRHDVWDVHTNKDRWWVITNPTNLYSQEQFPNMDLAITFHVGLCLRIPRSEKPKLADLPIEPFAECFRHLSEASAALTQAQEVSDYQAIGVRCREALLAFVHAAQVVMPWKSENEAPKRSDFKAWVEHICSVSLAGSSQKDRRQLFKTLLDSAWSFSNWLTHSKGSRWHDAEAAVSTAENTVSLCISSVIQHIRGVPDSCPACGSHRLLPERVSDPDNPDDVWECPTCMRCDWIGEPVNIRREPVAPSDDNRPPPEGECVIPTIPLRRLLKPEGR